MGSVRVFGCFYMALFALRIDELFSEP
uniref:Uncharacterized protein n=1 Tax=mine drainage metagenome TaxID=410659 RepID=E6PNV1_9ZZZZ